MELYEIVLSVLVAIISAIIVTILYYRTDWLRRGVPHGRSVFLFGNLNSVDREKHKVDMFSELYTKYKGTGPFCGLYLNLKPAVLVTDLELIERILIKDFEKIRNRGYYYNKRDDPLSAHLFALEDASWHQLRNKLAPVFSPDKIKFMFSAILAVGRHMEQVVYSSIDRGSSEINVKDLLARYMTDIVGTCAFGIECNSLHDSSNQLWVNVRRYFTNQRHQKWVLDLMHSFPKIARVLRMKITNKDIEDFFLGTVAATVKYRERSDIKANDFLNILLEMRNNQPGEDLSIDDIAREVYMFYWAGLETCSSTAAHALYLLAQHQEIQEELRHKVRDVLEKHENTLNYDSLAEMQYLDQVLRETLRLFTVVPYIQRVAKEDFAVDDSSFKIEKGSLVIIPTAAIHRDPNIYENPEKFDPSRFFHDSQNDKSPAEWLSFGAGPRTCIGMKLGLTQTKIAVALLINGFRFSVCQRTQSHNSLDSVFLKVERID